MQEFHLPLPQSPEYARCCEALGVPVRRMQREASGEIDLVWQVQSRGFGPLGRVDLISRGPVARSPEALTGWLSRVHRWQDGRPLLLNPDGLSPKALRDAGFFPLMTPASVALLPLTDTKTMRAALHQKWRNRLGKAEATGLRVTKHALSADHWLLAAETKQARQKGYRSLPPALSLAYARANPGKTVLWEVRQAGAPLAALLVLRHGRMATWQMGHNTPAGRKLNAMNLALWTAMTSLADQGHDLLDLGSINTQDAPGLARFKLGTGARLHQLGGSWLHYGALTPLARRLPVRLAA